ncbi:MAG TPA: hypothetical protein VM537_34930, partial [Anaerolineae bacterium]|nr:hypothetical protein [Anaerolineae bacterium]
MRPTVGAITGVRPSAASSRVVVVGLLPVALLSLLVLANAGTLVESSQMPDLIVEKLELYRQANVFAAHLTVKNQGTAQANGIEIRVFMRGFQAISQEHIPGRPGNLIADYDATTREGSCLISSNGELDPGDSETFVFNMVPVLMEPDPPAPSFGHRVQLAYQGPLNDTRYEKQANLALLQTSAAAGGEPAAPIAAAHAAAVRECDYLVVTHPLRLFSIAANTDAAVITLLSDMARFASTRYAALGYLD